LPTPYFKLHISFSKKYCHHPLFGYFPTRRSSDLFIARWTERGEALSQSTRAREQIHDIDGFWHKGSELVTRQSRIPGKSRISRRSEEHTSELQSRENLVCRFLLENKNYR